MAYVPIKPEELKKLIKMCKTRPMSFAYNPGPKGADLLLLDKILPPEKLGRTAKKEGEGPKAAYGTFELQGRNLNVIAIFALPEMARKLRKYLKTLGYSFSIEILSPDGQSLEKDLSEEDEEAQTAAPDAPAKAPEEATPAPPPAQPEVAEQAEAAAAPEAPVQSDGPADTAAEEADPAAAADQERRADLKNRIQALQAPVAALGEAGLPLKKAAAMVIGLVKSGSLDKAEATLSKIETGLAKAQKSAAAKPKDAAPAPDPKVMVARAGSLKKVLESVQGPGAAEVKKDLVQALALLKSRDLAGAEASLTSAEMKLNQLSERAAATEAPASEPVPEAMEAEAQAADSPEEPPTEQQAAEAPGDAQLRWENLAGDLQAEVDAAIDAKRGDIDGINRAYNYALSQAAAGSYESALKSADTTRRLIEEASAAQQDQRVAEAEDAIPDNTVAYRKSRLNWITTRNNLYADLVKLQMSIDAKAKEIEGLQDIAQHTSALVDYLEDLDSTLEDKLDALLNASDRAEQEKLKEESIRIIREYRSTLDGEFFQAVDQNGFTQTQIRANALDALSGVETALAA